MHPNGKLLASNQENFGIELQQHIDLFNSNAFFTLHKIFARLDCNSHNNFARLSRHCAFVECRVYAQYVKPFISIVCEQENELVFSCIDEFQFRK